MNLKDIIIELPKISDARGNLCIAEFRILPFTPHRMFWIYDIPPGKTRGGHAHKSCEELIVPLCGHFDIYVDDGHTNNVIKMSDPNKGIYIQKGVWCELRNFSPGTICLVFASEPYNAKGYVDDYESFKASFF